MVGSHSKTGSNGNGLGRRKSVQRENNDGSDEIEGV